MSAVGNISRHNERQNKQYANPNVDKEKSSENFHLKAPVCASYLTEFERIRKDENLKGQLHTKGKKQSNAVCEFMITSDSDFFKDKTQKEIHEFFSDAYEFVKQKCGEAHIISAVVHMDEKTPHLHATYIPVVDVQDRKGNPCKKIHCSEFWKGFNSYGELQDAFHTFITKKGHKLERGVVGSRAEHLTPLELKRKTLDNEIRSISVKMEQAKVRFIEAETKLKNMEGQILSQKKLDKIQPEAGMMGSIKGITIEDVKDLKKMAMEYFVLHEKMTDLSRKYVAVKGKLPTEAEKLETAKKMAQLEQLERDKVQLENTLRLHGIDKVSRRVLESKLKER